jgi:phenylpyruvate tautomerase PptA (4-oxalocrotonate tautomerase family)
MALRYMHSPKTVDALIKCFEGTIEPDTKQRIARSLVRLVNIERPYKGDTWWKTRPDTRGPYYFPTPWERTEQITKSLVEAAKNGKPVIRFVISELAKKDRVELPSF